MEVISKMSLSKPEVSVISFSDIVKGRDATVRTCNNEFSAVDISSVMSGKGINYAGEVRFFTRFCHANCVIKHLIKFVKCFSRFCHAKCVINLTDYSETGRTCFSIIQVHRAKSGRVRQC